MKIICALKSIVVLLCLIALSFISNGQVMHRDVVYLKNGTVIKGAVLEMVPNGNIKIKTADGSIFVYKMEEVEKTEKEEIAKTYSQSTRDDVNTEPTKNNFKRKGYFILGRLGPAAKLTFNSNSDIDITGGIINGYQINEYISIGIGIETLTYNFGDQPKWNIRAFPVFIDTRLYIPKKGRAQPMFFCQFGYAFTGAASVNTNYGNNNSYSSDFKPKSGGTFLALGAGVRIAASNRVSVLADGGLSFQTITGEAYSYSSTYSSTIKTLPALRFNLGIMVNLSK